jgi:hypothetical protein
MNVMYGQRALICVRNFYLLFLLTPIFEKLKKCHTILGTVCPNIAPLCNYIKMTEA